MNTLKSTFIAALLTFGLASSAAAKPTVNDMQQCQAVLDFTIERVSTVKGYEKADVKTVLRGLKEYNTFIQAEHIDPGLLKFTNGDKAAAKDYQKQINAYRKQIVTALKTRHPQSRIYSDQAVAINNCYSSAPMGDDKAEMMKASLQSIIKLAQQP